MYAESKNHRMRQARSTRQGINTVGMVRQENKRIDAIRRRSEGVYVRELERGFVSLSLRVWDRGVWSKVARNLN